MNHVHSRIETNIPFYLAHPVWTAIGLSMGPALSLGLGRISTRFNGVCGNTICRLSHSMDATVALRLTRILILPD
jgi:hypothetical protein